MTGGMSTALPPDLQARVRRAQGLKPAPGKESR